MKSVRVQVPGKIMLAGEYAVLRGAPALASTIRACLSVVIRARNHSGDVEVSSDQWSSPVLMSDVSKHLDKSTHAPLLTAVRLIIERDDIRDADVIVRSEIGANWGAGTSSALRLGVLIAGSRFAQKPDDLWSAAREAFRLQRTDQQSASGYDIATQVAARKENGLVQFQSDPQLSLSQWPHMAKLLAQGETIGLPQLVHPFVGGKGSPTHSGLQSTSTWLTQHHLWDRVLQSQGALVAALGSALANPNDAGLCCELVSATVAARQLFEGAPGFPSDIGSVLAEVSGHDKSWSWKTTGAGGEDAILLIGRAEDLKVAFAAMNDKGWHPLPATFGGHLQIESSFEDQ